MTKVTDKLPASIDQRLQDLAQMHKTKAGAELTYTDIGKFGKAATANDLKILRKILTQIEDEEGEVEETMDSAVNLVLHVVGRKESNFKGSKYDVATEINYYSEVIDNWGRTESSKKTEEIIKVLMSPKDFTDDMNFEGRRTKTPGSYSIDELEGKIVKVGRQYILVGFYKFDESVTKSVKINDVKPAKVK
jgi:hypothetical protein